MTKGKGRLLICQICRDKDYDENMIIEYHGKQRKRYHKGECHETYLKEEAKKKVENDEMGVLVEIIKDVHEINTIPNQFFSFLHDVRNGNEMFGKIGQKKSKQGYSFYVIGQTYLAHKDSINWAMNNREFQGTMNFLKYTLAIIKDKVASVEGSIESSKTQLADQKRQESVVMGYTEDDWTFSNVDNDGDISDLL